MFLKTLILLLVSFSLQAESINYKGRGANYILDYDKSGIELSGHQVELKLEKSKCNEDIINSFNYRITKLLKAKPLSLSKLKNGFTFDFNGKSYFENYKSKLGRTLHSMPKEIQRLKIENKFLCK